MVVARRNRRRRGTFKKRKRAASLAAFGKPNFAKRVRRTLGLRPMARKRAAPKRRAAPRRNRPVGSRHGPLHGAWKKAYKIAKSVWPFPKSLVRGVKVAPDTKIQIVHGNPDYQKKIVTKLICVSRTLNGSATNTGIAIKFDMTNVNDPMGAQDGNAPKYHDKWLAILGAGARITPLAATYMVKITKQQDSAEGVSFVKVASHTDAAPRVYTYDSSITSVAQNLRKYHVFWRLVGTDNALPTMGSDSATSLSLVEDMIASKRWNHRIMNEVHGRMSIVSFRVTVPNIPEWMQANNAEVLTATQLAFVMADGATGLQVGEQPTLQVVLISDNGGTLLGASAFVIDIETAHTILMEDKDFVGGLVQQPKNDD